MYVDRASGRSMDGRPGLAGALAAVESGEADALVVSRLDRLSRSLLDFAGLMERSRLDGWSLVALDLGVNTSTPSGEMMANVLAAFAQFERPPDRATDAREAVKRAHGVHVGRRSTVPAALRQRIVAERGPGRRCG